MKSFPLLFTLQYQEYTHYLKSKTFHILHFHEPSTMHFQMLHTQTYIFSLTILIFEQFHNSKSPKHFSYHCIHTLHSSISISQSNFSKEKKKKEANLRRFEPSPPLPPPSPMLAAPPPISSPPSHFPLLLHLYANFTTKLLTKFHKFHQSLQN